MAGPRTLALDAMGGDHGPEVTVPGAALALARHPELSFILFGDERRIAAALGQEPTLEGRVRVVHTDQAIASDDKPSQVIRRAKGSSMWLAIEAVKTGEAQGVVSAGNTGALMALAKLVLRPIAGVERPALAAFWPTVRGTPSIVLDVGANIGASARQLVQFALMGAAMARGSLGVERPTVGLLNVGSEEIKGNEEVKEANALLKSLTELPLDYKGFVEGDQIGQGAVDVVVVEGFAGNIALKTAEGTARQIATYLRAAMTSSLLTKAGALLAKGGFDDLKAKMDPRRVNGALFLGLSGIAIKSHGGTDALGFASAVNLGYQMADSGLIQRIGVDIEGVSGRLEAPGSGADRPGNGADKPGSGADKK